MALVIYIYNWLLHFYDIETQFHIHADQWLLWQFSTIFVAIFFFYLKFQMMKISTSEEMKSYESIGVLLSIISKTHASSSSLKTFKPESLRKTFCIPYFLCYCPITFSRYNSEMNKEKLQWEQNDKNYFINVAACISTNVVFCFDSRQSWEWISSLTHLPPMHPFSTT